MKWATIDGVARSDAVAGWIFGQWSRHPFAMILLVAVGDAALIILYAFGPRALIFGEDRWVEMATALLFLAAFVVGILHLFRSKQPARTRRGRAKSMSQTMRAPSLWTGSRRFAASGAARSCMPSRALLAGGSRTARRQARYKAYALHRYRRCVRILSQGRAVISDRLHAHIIATLLDLPHVVLDNSYGKLSSFVASWTRTLRSARCADSDAGRPVPVAVP